MTLTKAAQLGTKRSQKQRSAARKRDWSDFQKWCYANLLPKCQRCPAWLPDGVQPPNISHIEHRGMGGTWDEKINQLANIQVLCQNCHDQAPGWDGGEVPPLKDK